MDHKFPNIVQVGDRVKYINGEAFYLVTLIGADRNNGILCSIVRDNEYKKEYDGVLLNKLEVVDKNVNILSHEAIEIKTISNSHKAKTNPHKKVGMKSKTVQSKALQKDEAIEYLVTEFAPLISVNSPASDNDNIYSRKVIKGKIALASYILELDSAPVKYLRSVRILGREVKIDIKREVVIK